MEVLKYWMLLLSVFELFMIYSLLFIPETKFNNPILADKNDAYVRLWCLFLSLLGVSRFHWFLDPKNPTLYRLNYVIHLLEVVFFALELYCFQGKFSAEHILSKRPDWLVTEFVIFILNPLWLLVNYKHYTRKPQAASTITKPKPQKKTE